MAQFQLPPAARICRDSALMLGTLAVATLPPASWLPWAWLPLAGLNAILLWQIVRALGAMTRQPRPARIAPSAVAEDTTLILVPRERPSTVTELRAS